MTKAQDKAYAAALRRELAGLKARGLKDRAKLVEDELKRLGLDDDDKPAQSEAPEKAEGDRGSERAVQPQPRARKGD